MIEYIDQVLGYQFIESLKEWINLLLNRFVKLEVCELLNVEILIFIVNSHFCSILNQFYFLGTSKVILLYDEGLIQSLNVIADTPFEIVKEFIVKVL